MAKRKNIEECQMFYIINRTKEKITFNSIDEMFVYVNAGNDVVEGWVGFYE